MNTPQANHIITHNFIPVPREYFNRIVTPHLSATQSRSVASTTIFEIAGKMIQVHFYGTAVQERFSLALAHHPQHDPTHSPTPDLTIHAWDDTTTSSTMIAPWDDSSFNREYRLTHTLPSEDFFGIYVGGEETLSFYNPATKTGYFWTHRADRLPDWVTSAPFRTILHWFFSESHIHFMHGAVVGSEGHAVLLTAKSGSGKSTTALACLLDGMSYLADDYVAIERVRDHVVAHSLYHSAKITRDAMRHFPEMHTHIWNQRFGDAEKALFFLKEVFPQQLKRTARLNAIVIPKIITSSPDQLSPDQPFTTRLAPATKIQALLAIAPTTLLQLPLAETKKLEAFKEIINKIPCYFLELGPEVRAVPQVLKELLKQKSSTLSVSVILPVYNVGRYVGEAIESVLNQTCIPSGVSVEIICCDDGSTDNSYEVLTEYQRQYPDRITLLRNEHNLGIGATRNRCIEHATGTYVAFMDADDIWDHKKIEVQLHSFDKHPETDISFTWMQCFISPELPDSVKNIRACPTEPTPGIIPPTALIRRSAYDRVGPFNTEWKVGEFIDWLTRAKELGITYHVTTEVLFHRRIHETNTGVTERPSRTDYAKIAREALKRRRSAPPS